MKRKPPEPETGSEDCVIPPRVAQTMLADLTFGQPPRERKMVQDYMASQAADQKIVHLEKIKSEVVMSRKMGVWDVRTKSGNWWVITNPTNLYSQKLFPSCDYTLSFHVGLMARMLSRQPAGEDESHRRRFVAALTRFEQASKAFEAADEAEEIQAVGMRLRECLIRFVAEVDALKMVPDGQPSPKLGDVKGWCEIIAECVARGPSSDKIRHHLKATSKSAWDLVNWVTHAGNAVRQDGQIALDAVQAMLSSFFHALEKYESASPDRCPDCGSYRIVTDYRADLGIDPPYITLCERCGWLAPERARRFMEKMMKAQARGETEAREER